jgi:hypothetical protein
MDFTDKPMEAIKEWQDWYRKHPIVSESNFMTSVPENVKNMWIQKAQEGFADTLSEYQYELSGKELYKAFYAAAYEHMENAHKEYNRTKDLVDMLRFGNSTQEK